MAIQDDWSIDYANKLIAHASGSTRYTVNALYSWLQDVFDELSQLDDDVPMKANTPTEYELINGWAFDADADLGYLYGGAIKVNASDDLWANFYSLGTVETGGVLYLLQNGALVAMHPGYSSGHFDQLVKVRSGGADVDSRYVTVLCRTWSDSYDHFAIQAPTTGGRNPVPIATAIDLNNQTASGTVGAAPYTNITVTFGATTSDVDQDGTAEPYDVTVACAGLRLSQVYEYLKYLTRQASTTSLGGVEGRFYLGADAGYSPVKAAPFGTFAGGKFFGARGVLLTGYDAADANNLQLLDADNVTRTPPQSISVKVDNVAVGDRVFVARTSAGAIDKDQFTLAGAHSGGTTVTVNEAIGNDVPSAGPLRIGDDRYTYTGLVRGSKQFTGVSPTVGNYAGGQAAYAPVVDEQAAGTSVSVALTYASDFPVLARVRKKGILPFENTGTVTSAGLTISAIRTADGIVQ